MSLAQALAAQVPKKGPDCSVATILASLPPDDAKLLTDTLAAPQTIWPHASIARALGDEAQMGEHAVKVLPSTIGRHRKGDCTCGTR